MIRPILSAALGAVIPAVIPAVLLTVLLAVLMAAPAPARAFEAKDSDAFFLGGGSSNIEVRDSDDLLSGSNAFGGVRLGLFWTVFVELGYGMVGYNDTVVINGVSKSVDFRTTGANFGAGFIIPIRAVRLGLRGVRSPNNRWSEVIKDAITGATDSNISGKIDFDSYFVFTQFGQTGWFEVGVRRDRIKSSTSVLENSFGPYLAFNIPLGR
jgi:hypothetical protein